ANPDPERLTVLLGEQYDRALVPGVVHEFPALALEQPTVIVRYRLGAYRRSHRDLERVLSARLRDEARVGRKGHIGHDFGQLGTLGRCIVPARRNRERDREEQNGWTKHRAERLAGGSGWVK